jgi:hypothetical protein
MGLISPGHEINTGLPVDLAGRARLLFGGCRRLPLEVGQLAGTEKEKLCPSLL